MSGESTIKSSELEERQRLRVEEGGVIKFGIMSSCSMMAAVKFIHRNRCKTALRRKAPAVELSHVYDQEVS